MNRSTAHKSVNRSRLLQPGYLSGKSQPKSTTVRKTASVNNEGKKVFSRKQAVTSGTKSFESRAAFSNMTNSPEVNEAVVRTKNKSPSAISRTKLNNKTRSENENNFKPQESFTLKTPRYVNSFDKENEKKSASPALKSKPVGLKKSILQSNSDLKENTLEVQPRVRRLDFSQGSNSKVSENFEFGNISKKENLNFNADQNDIEFEADPNSLNCIMNEGGVTQKMLMDLRVPNQTKDGRASEVINNMRVFADGRPSGCMRVPINRPSTAGPRRVRNTGDGRISNAGRPQIRSSSAYKAAAVRSSLYTSSRKNSLAPSSTRPTQARASLYTSSKAVVRTSTYALSTRNAASVPSRKPIISSNPRKPEVTRNAYVPSKKFQNVKIERNVSVAKSSKKAVKWADERNDAAEEDLIEDSPNLKHSPISSRIVIATPRSILKDKSKRKAKQVIPMKTTKPPPADESDEEIEIVTPVVLNEEEPSSSGVDVADSGENNEEKPTTNHVSPNIKIERVLMELKRGMTSAKRRSLQTEYETVIQLIQRAAPAVMETLHENVEREDEAEVEKGVEVEQVADVKNKSKFDEEDEKERRNAEMLEDQIKNLKLEVEEIQSCRKERELQRSMMGFPTMTPLKSNYYSQQQQSSNHKLSTNCYASLNKPPTTAADSQSNYSAQKLHFSHQQGVNTSGSSQNSTPSKLQAVTKQQVPNKAAAADGNLSFFKPLPQQERLPRFFTPIKYALNSNSSDDDLSSKGTTWGDQLSQYKTVTTTTKQSAMPGAPSLNRVDAIISQQQEEKYTTSSSTLPSTAMTHTDVKEALSSSFRNHNKLSPPRCSSNKVYDDRSYTELAESSPLMKFHPATSSAVDSNLIFPAAQRFTVHTPHALRVYRQRLQEVRHSPYRRISRKYDEVLADEEVALYCSRMNSAAPLSPRTDFVDPVAHCLRFGDDDHFIPVSATPSPAAPTRFVSRSGKSSAFK